MFIQLPRNSSPKQCTNTFDIWVCFFHQNESYAEDIQIYVVVVIGVKDYGKMFSSFCLFPLCLLCLKCPLYMKLRLWSFKMRSPARAPMAIDGATVWPEIGSGITEESATRRRRMPLTLCNAKIQWGTAILLTIVVSSRMLFFDINTCVICSLLARIEQQPELGVDDCVISLFASHCAGGYGMPHRAKVHGYNAFPIFKRV